MPIAQPMRPSTTMVPIPRPPRPHCGRGTGVSGAAKAISGLRWVRGLHSSTCCVARKAASCSSSADKRIGAKAGDARAGVAPEDLKRATPQELKRTNALAQERQRQQHPRRRDRLFRARLRTRKPLRSLRRGDLTSVSTHRPLPDSEAGVRGLELRCAEERICS